MPGGNSVPSLDFVRAIVAEDLKQNKNEGRVVTRFPPEPNGFLHIGHAKSMCLNFGIALESGGRCHLRFDDTNPETEEEGYVEAIKEDVRWLGFDWGGDLFFASDYFERLYEFALELVRSGKAYVCSLSEEDIRKYRGTVTEPGRESPYRRRTVEENLDLFERMRSGEFEDGAHVLRARADMAAANMKMRDPLIFRIKKAEHYRRGLEWCIYPMYDFAHCLSDAIEGVTHSICTLEFENNREPYDWFLDNVTAGCHPLQIEFARLNLTYTVLSKRWLSRLVEGGHVSGWDDARMPTLSGMRRRGYTAAAIRDFCGRIGVAKADSMVDIKLLEHCLRDELNRTSPRVMAVLRPLKVVLENYPEGKVEELDAVNNPEDPSAGTRKIPLSRVIYIERDDFREEPHKKFYRLVPGREVRLRYGYIIKCEQSVKDEKTGEVIELRCSLDPDSKSGGPQASRKVKATIHWVSAEHAVPAEVRLYDYLFTKENPLEEAGGEDLASVLNPDSLEVLTSCRVEPGLAAAGSGSRYQFERLGYFIADTANCRDGKLVFNRTVTLRDEWAKIQKRENKPGG